MLVDDTAVKCRVRAKARAERTTANTAFRKLCGAVFLFAILAKDVIFTDHVTTGDASANAKVVRRAIEKRTKSTAFILQNVSTPLRFGLFGLASAAGLKEGDFIVGIEDIQVTSTGDISNILSGHKIGDIVKVTVSRNGKFVNIQLKLTELKPEQTKVSEN